jgi:hypothetical protein
MECNLDHQQKVNDKQHSENIIELTFLLFHYILQINQITAQQSMISTQSSTG